jgi:hypothetical protein
MDLTRDPTAVSPSHEFCLSAFQVPNDGIIHICIYISMSGDMCKIEQQQRRVHAL